MTGVRPKDWSWAAEAPMAVSSLSSLVGQLLEEDLEPRKHCPVDGRR